MEITIKKVSELIPYVNNTRTHNEAQVLQIAASIKEFGFTNPVLIDADGGIIAGHGRLLAAKKLSMSEVPCIELGHLSDTQKKAYIIADNKLALNAGWDEDLLKLELEALQNDDFDLSLVGFDEVELDELIENNSNGEGLTDPDDVPDVPEVPKTKLGDIYRLGNHRLMCGDSTDKATVEKLMDGKRADMVFTDPPFFNNSGIMHEMIKNIDAAFENSRLFCDGLALWFWDNLQFPCFGEKVTAKHIWHKTNGWQAGHFETIYAFHNDSKRHEQLVFSSNSVGGENKRSEQGNHPTPKPVHLPVSIFEKLSFGKAILDLFGGSGSTLMACEKTDRNCHMMELDPKYCDVIVKRWEDFTGKKAELITTK